jgi:hypothetical protein
MKNKFVWILICVILYSCRHHAEQTGSNPLFRFNENAESRWISFENQNGEKGGGGKENNGAKGHPCDSIGAGVAKVLLNLQGSGIINRMWITINDRSPQMLRSMKIEMFWDGESKPAVSAPFGDFFGVGLGCRTPFESELFADPEGRSFICYIQMPFKKSAKIIVTNESDKNLDMIFYDINYTLTPWNDDNLYFHCFWNRDTATVPGKDFSILPEIKGKGRYLGANIGINANPAYENNWWGEGEVKMYLDGDSEFPTLVGTGSEDFAGSAWGLGKFINRYSGCTVADTGKHQWAFYRYHIPDPVFFKGDCKVAIQLIGGSMKSNVIRMIEKGVKLIPVTVHQAPVLSRFFKKDSVVDLRSDKLPEAWTNFYRSDDVSSTAYFYLDEPKNDLPILQSFAIRTCNLKDK